MRRLHLDPDLPAYVDDAWARTQFRRLMRGHSPFATAVAVALLDGTDAGKWSPLILADLDDARREEVAALTAKAVEERRLQPFAVAAGLDVLRERAPKGRGRDVLAHPVGRPFFRLVVQRGDRFAVTSLTRREVRRAPQPRPGGRSCR